VNEFRRTFRRLRPLTSDSWYQVRNDLLPIRYDSVNLRTLSRSGPSPLPSPVKKERRIAVKYYLAGLNVATRVEVH